VLEETLEEFQNTEVIHQDALRFTPPSTPYKVVANIPYNITSPLINHFLQADNKPSSITFLVQKEVAEKICKSTPDMTILSLQVYLFGTPTFIAKVPAQSFLPPPKVDSAILHINLHNDFQKQEALEILKLAKRAFRGRRKKLSNTLPEYKEILTKLEILDQRPQHLTIAQWAHLNKLVSSMK
jgi:16S rRNA (adenine1518-N6/adenine1519-N6)-dimethyltransferase